jgi:hypothetical protein
MERQLQIVWTLSLIRQVVQKTFSCPDVSLHYPYAQTLLWKLRTAEVQPSGRGPFQEKISTLFWKADCTVVRPDAFSYRQDAA